MDYCSSYMSFILILQKFFWSDLPRPPTAKTRNFGTPFRFFQFLKFFKNFYAESEKKSSTIQLFFTDCENSIPTSRNSCLKQKPRFFDSKKRGFRFKHENLDEDKRFWKALRCLTILLGFCKKNFRKNQKMKKQIRRGADFDPKITILGISRPG